MKEMIREYFDLVYKHRKLLTRIFIVVFIFFIGYNGLFFVSAYYPKSCIVCHYMDPYYEQWKTSKHSGVNCLKCHKFNPLFISVTTVKYLTGLYNPRPHANVENSSCMAGDCHLRRIEKPNEYLEGEIAFDHKEHLMKLKRGESLRCTSCHYQIVQGEHISVDKKVCFLCHFKGMKKGQAIGGCPSCHGTPTKVVEREGFYFSHDSYLKLGVECKQCHINVASGKGEVPGKKCFECHAEKERKDYDGVTLHRIHVTLNGFDCFKCHQEVKHGEVELVRVFEVKCDTCHKKLHSNQKEMYMGTGAKGVPDTPSRMFSAQVSCDGCHTQAVQQVEGGVKVMGEASLEPEKKSCVVCHGKGYDRMLDDWVASSKELESMMGRVRSEAVKLKVGAPAKSLAKDVSEMVTDIEYNYDFLRSGRGSHNIEYAWRIVKTAFTQLELASKLAGKKTISRPELLSGDSGYCTKFCHTRLGIPEKLYFREMQLDFPHREHIEDVEINCSACHSPQKHKMRIVTKSECMSCHHEGDDVQCSRCHGFQDALYSGKVNVEGIDPSPDYMMEGDVSCDGCHDLSSGKSQDVIEIKGKCAKCHEDDSYGTMALDWEKEILDLENRVAVDLEEATQMVERMKRLGRETEKIEARLESAGKSYDLVSRGRGIHNYELSMELLSSARENLKSILGQ